MLLFQNHTEGINLSRNERIRIMTKNVCRKFRCSLYLILFFLLLICLSSCYPEFKNPIPPPAELKADHQVLGTWVRTYKVDQDEYKDQLSIFQRSSGWIDAVWIYDIDKKDSTDGVSLLVLEGYSTSVMLQLELDTSRI